MGRLPSSGDDALSRREVFARVAITLLVLMALALACTERVDVGNLTVRIVSPSAEDTFASSAGIVSFGGNVGGWSIIDSAPVIRWRNEATGESGETGPLSGTWVVRDGVNLQPGTNRLTVQAKNGVQQDASDAITVYFEPSAAVEPMP